MYLPFGMKNGTEKMCCDGQVYVGEGNGGVVIIFSVVIKWRLWWFLKQACVLVSEKLVWDLISSTEDQSAFGTDWNRYLNWLQKKIIWSVTQKMQFLLVLSTLRAFQSPWVILEFVEFQRITLYLPYFSRVHYAPVFRYLIIGKENTNNSLVMNPTKFIYQIPNNTQKPSHRSRWTQKLSCESKSCFTWLTVKQFLFFILFPFD